MKVLGGRVSIERKYMDGRWQINAHWNNLKLNYDNLDGSVKSIDRNGAVYQRYGDAWTLDRKTLIRRAEVNMLPIAPTTEPGAGIPGAGGQAVTKVDGYRWQNRTGDWIHYDSTGRIVAYGDKNNVTVWFQYDATGKLKYILDHFGRVVFIYSWTGEQVTQIRDNPAMIAGYGASARAVAYAYSGISSTVPAYPLLTKVTDVLGHETLYTYTAGKLQTLKDAEGRERTLTYGPTGRISSVREADGSQTNYVYDYDKTTQQFYARVSVETPSGRKVDESWYDKDGRFIRRAVNGRTTIIVETDLATGNVFYRGPNGSSTATQKDEFDNIVKVTNADGSISTAKYLAVNGQLGEEVDALGVKTQYEYDAVGNLIRMTEAVGLPEQRITEYLVDGHGQLKRATRRGGTVRLPNAVEVSIADASIEYDYDNRGNLIKLTDAEGNVAYFKHDLVGNETEITDARGKVWKTEYNASGNVVREEDPLGHANAYAQDKVGNWIRTTDPRGKVFNFEYDPRDRLIKTIDAYGKAFVVNYDAAGRWTGGTDEEGRPLGQLEYNADGFLISVKDAKGNTIRYEYEDGSDSDTISGMPKRIIFPTYQRHFRFDSRKRVTLDTTVVGTEGIVWGHTYDAKGNQKTMTDPNGKTLFYEYDAYGRITKVTNRVKATIEFAYDQRGNIVAVQDGNGNSTRFEYDRANRLVKEIRPLGQSVSYSYDAEGNHTETRLANGARKTYGYDDAGRLARSELFAAGSNTPERVVNFTYDPSDNLIGWSDGEASALFAYDDNELQTTETVNYGAFSLSYSYAYYANSLKKSITYPAGLTVAFTYDDQNELERVDIPGEGSITVNEFTWLAPKKVTLPGGTVVERDHDGLLNLTALKVRDPGQAVVVDLANKYGKLQELTEKTLDNATTAYVYDAETRLKQVTGDNGGQGAESFGVDAVDNRITHSAVSGQWQYDANNRLIAKGATTYEYDSSGNLIKKTDGTAVRIYRYDAENRLVAVEDDAGAFIARYGYDPFDRRLWKEVGGVRTYFLYSHEGLLAEADATGVVTKLYGWRPDHVWGTDPLFVKSGSTVAYFHNDQIGAPMRATDKTGAIVWSADYGAFGKAGVTVSTVNHELRLPGQYEDAETGLHYNYRRYYDPETGRYVSEDPIGLAGGFNLYGYARHDPLNRIDPTGENPLVIQVGKQYLACLGKCVAQSLGFAVAGELIESVLCDDNPELQDIKDQLGDIIKGCALDCLNPLNYLGNKKWKQKKCPCNCNSFVGETLVHAKDANGNPVLKPIRDIRVGDEVLAWSEWKQPGEQVSYEKVTDVFTSHKEQQLVHITLDTGEKITATAGHPFHTPEGWRDAQLLKAGGQLDLKGSDGILKSTSVATIEIRNQVVPVFNLEVANANTFFVGQEGVLVHNEKGIDCRIGNIAENTVVRTTRSGEQAVRITRSDGSVIDISPRRVKEYVPSSHPKAPPGTLDRVKFSNSLPGSKGYKRPPTSEDLDILDKLTKGSAK